MTKRKKRKTPTKFKTARKLVHDLVSKTGVSKMIVVRQLELPKNFFSQYVGEDENYNKALASFQTKVLMGAVVDTLEMDSQAKKFLMTKHRLFDQEITLPHEKMTEARHATENLSFALDAYCRKLISQDSLQQIRSACDSFSSLHATTELEARLENIEQMLKNK